MIKTGQKSQEGFRGSQQKPQVFWQP